MGIRPVCPNPDPGPKFRHARHAYGRSFDTPAGLKMSIFCILRLYLRWGPGLAALASAGFRTGFALRAEAGRLGRRQTAHTVGALGRRSAAVVNRGFAARAGPGHRRPKPG